MPSKGFSSSSQEGVSRSKPGATEHMLLPSTGLHHRCCACPRFQPSRSHGVEPKLPEPSCEAELYALGSAASESHRLASFLTEQHVLRGAPKIHADSSAPQVSGRPGEGRLKHVKARLHTRVGDSKDRIHVVKSATEDNMADPLTKFVTEASKAKFLLLLEVRVHA